MTSRITGFDPPHTFTDEQVRGPFHSFRHVHTFQPTPDGTEMVDQVTFVAPFGPIGRLAERIALARHLRGLIETGTAGYAIGWLAGEADTAQVIRSPSLSLWSVPVWVKPFLASTRWLATLGTAVLAVTTSTGLASTSPANRAGMSRPTAVVASHLPHADRFIP